MKIQNRVKIESFIKEISEYSMTLLKNVTLIPREEHMIYSYLPLLGYNGNGRVGSDSFYRFKKVRMEHSIIGVDASIIPIAESGRGYVFGLRGAAVKYDPILNDYTVYIEGPFILYLNDEILKYFREYLSSRFFMYDVRGVLNYVYAKKIILNIYEWLLIRRIIVDNPDTIVLVDGVIEPKYVSKSFYSKVLDILHSKGIYIIGFSKRSKYLKYFSEVASTLLTLGLEGMINISIPGKRFSKVFIGLLRRGGCPFRIDILRDVPLSIMDEIYSSNLNIVGYPDVLKEAHVFSKLNRRDAILLRAIMAKNGAKIRRSEPYRELIMGAIEHWGEGNEAI